MIYDTWQWDMGDEQTAWGRVVQNCNEQDQIDISVYSDWTMWNSENCEDWKQTVQQLGKADWNGLGMESGKMILIGLNNAQNKGRVRQMDDHERVLMRLQKVLLCIIVYTQI